MQIILSVDATNFKSEAHAGPLLSTYEEMVDHSETEMEETRTLATEERPRTQAAFEPEKTKYVGTTTNTGTATTNEGTKLDTEEKLQSKTNSEPPTMTDVVNLCLTLFLIFNRWRHEFTIFSSICRFFCEILASVVNCALYILLDFYQMFSHLQPIFPGGSVSLHSKISCQKEFNKKKKS
jgi:hypothetical protein